MNLSGWSPLVAEKPSRNEGGTHGIDDEDDLARRRWQDIAEYALMLAVVLLIVVAAVSAIGTNANTVFNSAASKLTTG